MNPLTLLLAAALSFAAPRAATHPSGASRSVVTGQRIRALPGKPQARSTECQHHAAPLLRWPARLSSPVLGQLTLSTVPGEAWALLAAVVGFITWAAKRFLFRPHKPRPEHITRLEFHQELDRMRDRIGAGYIALSDKIDAANQDTLTALTAKMDASHQQIISAITKLSEKTESRLDNHESALTRLDERTSAHL